MTKLTHMIFWIWMQCWIFRWALAFMVQRFSYNNLMNFVKSDLLVKSLLFIPPFWYIRLLNSGVFFTKWGKEIQQMSNRDILLVWQEKKLFDLEGMIKTTRAQWMSKKYIYERKISSIVTFNKILSLPPTFLKKIFKIWFWFAGEKPDKLFFVLRAGRVELVIVCDPLWGLSG